MTYKLGIKSLSKLNGVHPDLVKVVKRAIELSSQDFSVLYGVRTAEEQNSIYQQGRTKPGKIVTYKDGYSKKSNHQVRGDGLGYAVDLIPYPVDWNDWGKFESIDSAIQEAANELGIVVQWGGNWKMRDGAHWELVGRK